MTEFQGTRRDMLRLGGGALALSALSARASSATGDRQFVRGVVFEDRSGSGVRQTDDPGIPGVLVSNGREVARTDAAGRYVLPVEPGCVVFVIKPAAWSPPVDPLTNLPKFYRLHQPEGSPSSLGLSYPGVDPTGDPPESLDFPLRRAPESARFDVLMLADPQPADLAEIDYLRESFLETMTATNAAFGVTLGDVMSDNLGLYDQYNLLLGQVGAPWWNLPGNHDLNYEASGRRYCRETWKRVFGPPWHAFEQGEALFIMLDNVDWRRDGANGGGYAGNIGAEQLDFVYNLLAHTPREKLIVVCMHIPLVSSDPSPGCNTADRARLLELLGDRPAASFSGHMHTSEHHYLDRPGGGEKHRHQVLAALSGSWWSGPFGPDGLPLAQCCDGAPNGFHVLSIEGTRWSTRLVSRESSPMRIMLESPARESGTRMTTRLSESCTRGAEIVVNIFDGGPGCHVEATIADHAPVTMRRVARPDPFTLDLYSRNQDVIKPWVEARDSSHLWTAPLPSLRRGFHRLSVEARDEFGRRHARALVIEVTA